MLLTRNKCKKVMYIFKNNLFRSPDESTIEY